MFKFVWSRIQFQLHLQMRRFLDKFALTRTFCLCSSGSCSGCPWWILFIVILFMNNVIFAFAADSTTAHALAFILFYILLFCFACFCLFSSGFAFFHVVMLTNLRFVLILLVWFRSMSIFFVASCFVLRVYFLIYSVLFCI